jgi:hypothetical protein
MSSIRSSQDTTMLAPPAHSRGCVPNLPGKSPRGAPHRHRRLGMTLATATTLAVGALLAVGTLPLPAHAAPGAAATDRASLAAAAPAEDHGGYRDLRWTALVPRDWDPLKDLRGVDLAMMSDGDPRAIKLLGRMREVWDNAPTNAELQGAAVRLPGFVVPLEESKGVMKEFLLVPYYGACIHTPPPPSNQTVHVVVAKGVKGLRMMEALWVSGTLAIVRNDSYMGTASYRLDAAKVEPYVAPSLPPAQPAPR